MTQRLPTVGGDTGTWGTVLNGYLSVSLNSDGTLNTSAVSAAGAEMTSNKNAASGYAGLDASSKVNIANLPTGTSSTTVAIGNDSRITGALQASNNLSDLANSTTARSNIGLGNVDNTSDATKNSATVTLTNKRITLRVTSVADGTSITPAGDTSDLVKQTNTQAAGTLTINAPTGTPTGGQSLIIRIKCTNTQTYSFDAIYRGSLDTPLPTTSYGSSYTEYMKFMYNADDSKWDFVAYSGGY